MKECLCRWKDHFNDLLNKPCDATDAELQRDVEQATPDADSHTDLVTSSEVELCLKRLKNRLPLESVPLLQNCSKRVGTR